MTIGTGASNVTKVILYEKGCLPLVERLIDCKRLIGDMCEHGHGPKMSIPAQPYDDDIFSGFRQTIKHKRDGDKLLDPPPEGAG